MAPTLLAGYLKNAELAVDASSIFLNIIGWMMMIGNGFNASVSVRVSNELGANHPRAAKFCAVVVGATSFLISLFIALILFIARKQYPSLFSSNAEVRALVYELTPLLALGIVAFNIQLSLAGVAIGAGWQAFVAYVNLGCYYLFGIPLALLLGFKLNMGVPGIWWGVVSGTILEGCVILWIIGKRDWNKEGFIAADRLKQWGGDSGETHDSEI